jgi:hypothetical protein
MGNLQSTNTKEMISLKKIVLKHAGIHGTVYFGLLVSGRHENRTVTRL